MTNINYQQPWLKSASSDTWLVLLPAVIPLIIIIVFKDYFIQQTEVTTMWWVLLVVAIDVSHVYSTVFRFYWDKQTFQTYRSVIFIIPIIAFVIGFLLHFFGAIFFWRAIAYLAVFHFIRQQYGFMRLYSRKEIYDKTNRLIDSFCIYNATLYPILYWHFYLTSELHWFIPGDFMEFPDSLASFFWIGYWIIIIIYAGKEIFISFRSKSFNIPKNALIIGTYFSWYFGIVVFKGDLTFTLLNVVAHGIPYMALVYFHSSKKLATFTPPWKSIAIFICAIFVFAYFEEGLWDGMIWRDHATVFPVFSLLPMINNPVLLSIIVPLLALPQITHYVLDGFIWKVSNSKSKVTS